MSEPETGGYLSYDPTKENVHSATDPDKSPRPGLTNQNWKPTGSTGWGGQSIIFGTEILHRTPEPPESSESKRQVIATLFLRHSNSVLICSLF